LFLIDFGFAFVCLFFVFVFLVTRLTGYPIAKEFNPTTDADQFVVFNQYQALPLFVVYYH
jgi:hypothetical protein